MLYRYLRPHGRAEVGPAGSDKPVGVCQRCGFLYNLPELVWQYQVRGPGVRNARILVCTRTCVDDLQRNFFPDVLPIDPPPLFNTRPEAFFLDEVDVLSTQTEVPITTQSGDEIPVNQPSQNFSDPPGE